MKEILTVAFRGLLLKRSSSPLLNVLCNTALVAAIPTTDPVLALKKNVEQAIAIWLLSIPAVSATKAPDCTSPLPNPLYTPSVMIDCQLHKRLSYPGTIYKDFHQLVCPCHSEKRRK